MALKADRIEIHYDERCYMNEVATRGGIASMKGGAVPTAGYGGYPGNAANICTYAANPSGCVPLGMLLCDVVSLDQTHYHLNFYKEQAPSGGKVVLGRSGRWTTNNIYGTPTPGPAYLHSGGNISSTQLTGAPQVGKFLTTLDEDGYAMVLVQL